MCNWIRDSFSMGHFAGKSRSVGYCSCCKVEVVMRQCCPIALYCRKPTCLIGSDRFVIMLVRYLSLQPALIHELLICIWWMCWFLSGSCIVGGSLACAVAIESRLQAYVHRRFGERAGDRLAVRTGRWWSGGKAMADSQVYPKTFGYAAS